MELNIWDDFENCYKTYPIEDVEDALLDLSTAELMQLKDKITQIIWDKDIIEEN